MPELRADGIWRVSTAMPGHSFGSLNSYLVVGDERIALIDVPWGRADVVAELEQGIRSTGHRPEDIDLILLTHYHEDHSGAAGILRNRYGAQIGIHAEDAEILHWRQGAGTEFRTRLRRWLDEVGADDAAQSFALLQFVELQGLNSVTDIDLILSGGQSIDLGGRALHVIHTPGHTPGHVCFFDDRTTGTFSGDHVFAHRRANATARPIAARRPIADYWRSMKVLRDRGVRRLYPGHEGVIDDLGKRVAELAGVRDRKLAETVRLATGRTAWQIAQRVRRRLPWAELGGNARLAAVGETLAYLLEAEDKGTVIRSGRRPAIWRRTGSGAVGEGEL